VAGPRRTAFTEGARAISHLSGLPPEVLYVGLLFVLFVVPRLLERFRLPGAITSFLLGGVLGIAFDLFHHDHTVNLLSVFGITAIFLFAGMEVELSALRAGARAILVHLVLRGILLGLGALAIGSLFGMDARPSWLVSLALFTPSTGFILGSLHVFRLNDNQREAAKQMAIAAEMMALLVLFLVMQSDSFPKLALATGALVGLLAVLPLIFLAFARWMMPHAPKSEFAFLLMMAVVCAFATQRIGVYYLVGAFLVGMAARMFRQQIAGLASDRLLFAVEVFASFFAPFYFFNAGLHLDRDTFSLGALKIGVGFILVAVPLNYALVAMPRRPSSDSLARLSRTAVAMLPTLVFTLVLAGILRDRFNAPAQLIGGLVIYTVVSTLLPGFLLGTAPAHWDAPELEDLVDLPDRNAGS
jgi:Kef-type K+ transport system membrane component KefB